MAAVAAGMLAWRRVAPASFAAHRQLPAALLRVAVAASPTAWHVTRQSLDGAPPPYGSSMFANIALYGLTILFCSFGATTNVLVRGQWCGGAGTAMPGLPLPCRSAAQPLQLCTSALAPMPALQPPQALARPLALRVQLPAQAATMWLISRYNGEICATAALQHPAAQAATAAMHSALSRLLRCASLALALPAPAPPPSSSAGQCWAVLALAELLMGFLLPTLVLAASEAALHARWHAHWLRWQRQQGGSVSFAEGAGGSGSEELSEGTLPSRRRQGAARGKLDTRRHPWLQPPSRLAAGGYAALRACLQLSEPADVAVAMLTGAALLCATWQTVTLLSPA